MTGELLQGEKTELAKSAPAITVDIVIATRNRPEPLRECLRTVNAQTCLPSRVLIIDSSDHLQTQELVAALGQDLRFPCSCHRTAISSAAQQRNVGADLCTSELILFLDDDVTLEPDFIGEILRVFETSPANLGGVSGTIANQVYTDPHGLNRILLGLCLGRLQGGYAGKVVGPAVNFLAADGPDQLHFAEWLPSTCVAYRRSVFLSHRFETTFDGYSFAEDLHLSARIARSFRLAVTTRARVVHADLGKETHRDWVALGESQVRNRWLIMTSVLDRNGLADQMRLFAYEMIYVPMAWLAAGRSSRRVKTLAQLLRGKLRGFIKIWTAGNSPSATKAA